MESRFFSLRVAMGDPPCAWTTGVRLHGSDERTLFTVESLQGGEHLEPMAANAVGEPVPGASMRCRR